MKVEKHETPIREVFGDSPKVKVLDTLIENPRLDYSKKELAEASGVSKSTLYKLWDELEGEDIVEETRKIGNATLYKLNENSRIVRELVRFEKRLLRSDEKSVEA
ncbi:MAG: hypothetical protein ACLFUR_06485 [Candidatus Hadarchaeia archaeon]